MLIMNRILFFHRQNDFTGSTRVLANIIESDCSDSQVDVITIDRKGCFSTIPNVRILSICYPRFRGKSIPILSGLVWRVHAWLLTLFYGRCYDVFYINTIVPYYAAIIGTLYGKKIIYHVHEKFVVKSLFVKVAEFVFNHVQAKRIFVSKYVRDQYPAKKGCDSVVKYNTLPQSFISAVRIRPLNERKRNTVLMIASLSKAKGIFNFLRLAELMPDLRFRLLLSANMNDVKVFIGRYIPENVELIPVQSSIHQYLYDADLMLNLSIPSLWIETFGMTVLEAMAYGIPSIVPNIGGPTELVQNDYNGYCVNVTNMELVRSTIRIALDENNYGRLCYGTFKRYEWLRSC